MATSVRNFGKSTIHMLILKSSKYTVNVLNFEHFTFSFQRSCGLFGLKFTKYILVRIANREDPDQTASSEAV